MLLRPVLNARARPFRPASARVAVCSKKVPKVVAGRLRAFGVRMPRVRRIVPESFAKLLRNLNRNGFGTAPWTRSGALRSLWRQPSDALRVSIPAAVLASIRPFADQSPPTKAVSTGSPRVKIGFGVLSCRRGGRRLNNCIGPSPRVFSESMLKIEGVRFPANPVATNRVVPATRPGARPPAHSPPDGQNRNPTCSPNSMPNGA